MDIEKLQKIIEREIDNVPMVLTDPLTLRRLRAERLAQAAWSAISDRVVVKGGAGHDALLSLAVGALKEARAALHFHYVEWDGEPEDAVPLQLARAKCDQAISVLSENAHPPKVDLAGVDELVGRLRTEYFSQWHSGDARKAADTIEVLATQLAEARAENERLREALRELVEEYVHNVDSTRLGGFYLDPETEDCVIDARAALKGNPNG